MFVLGATTALGAHSTTALGAHLPCLTSLESINSPLTSLTPSSPQSTTAQSFWAQRPSCAWRHG
jgi:hypothetical protein